MNNFVCLLNLGIKGATGEPGFPGPSGISGPPGERGFPGGNGKLRYANNSSTYAFCCRITWSPR